MSTVIAWGFSMTEDDLLISRQVKQLCFMVNAFWWWMHYHEMQTVLYFVIWPWELEVSLIDILFFLFTFFKFLWQIVQHLPLLLLWIVLTKGHFYIYKKCTKKKKPTVSLRDLVTVHILKHHQLLKCNCRIIQFILLVPTCLR